MFTLEQIKQAQSKISTGADFPAYAQDLKALDIQGYHSYVGDGRVIYYGNDGFWLDSGPQYAEMEISDRSNTGNFKERLKHHQEGKSSYPEFVQDAASSGVEKWEVDLRSMTCIYFDRGGSKMLEEGIPRPA